MHLGDGKLTIDHHPCFDYFLGMALDNISLTNERPPELGGIAALRQEAFASLPQLTNSVLLNNELLLHEPPAERDSQPEKKSYLNYGVRYLADKVVPGNHELAREIAHYGTNFLKSMSLFMPGKTAKGSLALGAWGATALICALDQASPDDNAGRQALDLVLGTGKGLALRGTFLLCDNIKSIPLKGVSIGSLSRLAETSLDSRNYENRSTGDCDIMGGASRILRNTFSLEYLGTDIALFGAAHLMTGKIDALAGGRIGRSVFLQTASTGFSFGTASGALEEIQKQQKEGRSFSNIKWQNVLGRSLLRGGLDSIAAMPGGAYSARIQNRAIATEKQNLREARPFNDSTTTEPLRLQVPVEKLDMPTPQPSTIKSAEGKLSAPAKGTELFAELKSEPTPESAKTQDQFVDKHLDMVSGDVLVWKVMGTNTEIVAPVEYARSLEQVRQLRRVAELDPSAPGVDKVAVEEARRKLADHEHGNHVLPEDVVNGLHQSGLGSIPRKIILIDKQNPMDRFWEMQTGSLFKSSAQATPDGTIRLFQLNRPSGTSERYSPIGERLRHEISHLIKWNAGTTGTSFENILKLEPGIRPREPYSPSDVDEAFAVHLGEKLLHPDTDVFWIAARENPVATCASFKLLQTKLDPLNTPEWLRNRIAEVDKHIRPLAEAKLRTEINTNPGTPLGSLLLFVGGERALSDLSGSRILDLTRTELSPPAMETLGANKGIGTLRLSFAKFAEGDLSRLTNMGLQGLDLTGTPITDASIPMLSAMTGLKTLDISGTKISLSGYFQLRGTLSGTQVRRR